MHFYADQGITRISFGVQDFDEKIGKILNRENSPEMIKRLIPDEVRKRFEGVNFGFNIWYARANNGNLACNYR